MKLKLLPRHGIDLFAPHGDGPKFVGDFRETWRRMPLYARRRILAYWHDPPIRCRVHLGYSIPTMELLDAWSCVGRQPIAMVDVWGCRVRFHAERFHLMPADVCRDVIAHELAHVLQRSNDPDADWGADHAADEIEAEADEITDAWGFDPESVDRWSQESGRTRVWTNADLEALTAEERAELEADLKHSGRGFGVLTILAELDRRRAGRPSLLGKGAGDGEEE